MLWLVIEVALANLLTRFVALAAALWVSHRSLARWGERLLGVASGFLATLSLTHLLPEAFESEAADPHALGLVMLGTLFAFVLLGLASGHAHAHGHDHDRQAAEHRSDAGALLTGAALHNIVDGTLVAAAFMTDARAGWLAAAAVLVHEIPQQIGYAIVLKNCGYSERKTVACLAALALAALFGGVLGCGAVGMSAELLPYLLAASSVAFLYITFSALLPEVLHAALQKGTAGARLQVAASLAAGAALSMALLGVGHGHEHGLAHAHDHAAETVETVEASGADEHGAEHAFADENTAPRPVTEKPETPGVR